MSTPTDEYRIVESPAEFPNTSAGIEAAFLESPNWVTVPRWVQLSGVSTVARALADELVDSANRVHGDMAPTLDREYLAWVVGVSRYDKIARALRELVDIGFLVIYSGGADRNGNRLHRYDSRTGRKLPDTYGLRPNPPDWYAGPRNTTEAYELFLRDRDEARARSGGSKRALSIPRKSYTRVSAFAQVKTTSPMKDVASSPAPSEGDTHSESAGRPHISCEGCGHTPCEGCGHLYAGRIHTPELRVRARRLDLSPSGRERPEGERDDDPGTGGAAEPPAPGEGHGQAVADLVARLPWKAWAERHNPEFVLNRSDSDRVQHVITRAMRSHDLDLDTAQEVAVAALSRATGKNKTGSPVPYVAGAFEDRRLPGWLGAVCPAELSENPLPLPTPHDGGEHAAAGNTAATTATSAPPPPASAEIPQWCGQCADGDPRATVAWTMRRVETAHDVLSPCPVCHPDNV